MSRTAWFSETDAAGWAPVQNAQWNRVTPLTRASPWLVTTLKALADLAQLPDNWDGYGSPAVQPAALEAARRLVSVVEMEDLPTPSACPVSGGGLGLNWQAGRRELEIEILPDGSIEYLLVDTNTALGPEWTLEGRLPLDFTDRVRRLVGWLRGG